MVPASERFRSPSRLAALAAIVLAALLAVGPAVSAQSSSSGGATTAAQAGDQSQSTTTTTTQSGVFPGESTTTTQPGGEDGPSQEEQPPSPEDDAPADEVPQEEVEVPPPPEEAEPDPVAPILQQVTTMSLAEAEAAAQQAAKIRAEVFAKYDALSGDVAALEAELARLEAEQAKAVARLQRARSLLRRRAVASYIGSPTAAVNQLLDSEDINELSRRTTYAREVVRTDRDRVEEYLAARKAVSTELAAVVEQLDAYRAEMLVAGASLDGADSSLLAKEIVLAAIRAGDGIVGLGGFVFPVGQPYSFGDTWGAPRMFGTPYAHTHQGTDIFAPHGTPLLACERGVLIRIGTDTLGGTKLWLVGASGTRYYYAHLSGYAEDVYEGKPVQAGDVIGFVGNSGNAQTTPAHLHFQVHPGGGPPVNPYPLLRIVDDAQKRYNAQSGGSGPRPAA